jgi:RNA polymerase sigma-70 factor (ECF subfamily)
MDMEVDALPALMARYAQGDDAAFQHLYARLAPRLHRFCRRLAGRRGDPDDLLQETFLRMHRARHTYMVGANVLHWAFAIARSACLDRLRYWRRRPEDPGGPNDVAEDDWRQCDASHDPEARAAAQDLLDVVTLELDRMSEKNRTAYVLLRHEGLKVSEAALVLGTTVDVVKQRAHRAYEQLRSALGAAGWKEYEHDGSAAAVRS